VKVLLAKFLSARAEEIMGKSMEDQVKYWAKNTRFMESGSKALCLVNVGDPLYPPSCGPHATRIANLGIPSPEDPDFLIPVTCAAPHDAAVEAKLPLILFFYMGGIVMGSIEAELPISRWLAQEAHAVVCSVGYRKVPEFPYPTPINDVVDASIGILEQRVSVASLLGTGIDFDRVATWE
jgi:acetyl esterase/lipase